MKSNESLFRDAPVWKAILSVSIPSVFTILIMLVYNVTDMYFIGQIGNNAQIGAISVVTPAFSIFNALATMIGIGGSSAIARVFGAGDKDTARILSSLCGWTCLCAGTLGAAFLIIFSDQMLGVLGATPDMWEYAKSYMRILASGAPFMLFSVGFASLLRSEGAILHGFIGNLFGTLTNIVLDPILILGLHMGTAGAAAATVAGNMVASLYYLIYVLKKSEILTLNPALAMRKPQALVHILMIGLPNALSSILSGFSSTFGNRLLSQYGSMALAANGAAGKVMLLITMIQMGICMGAQPLMAYNYGAKNSARLKEILQKLIILTVSFGAVSTVICTFARHFLISIFLKDAAAAAMGEQIVVWLLAAGPVIGLFYLGTNFLQASGNAARATFVSVLRQGLLLIPLLYLMHTLLGFTGIAAAHFVADAGSAIIAVLIAWSQYRKLTD